MAKPKKENEDAKPVTLDEIARFARTLAYLAEQYAEQVEAIRGHGESEVKIGGHPTAVRGEGYLRGWLKTIREAVDDMAIARTPLITPDQRAAIDANLAEALDKTPAKEPNNKP